MACCIAYNAHGGYCVPLSSAHRPAAQRILDGKVWEPSTLSLLCEEASRGDIVHAGTYFGDFLPAVAQACAAGQLVWGFEPNEESFRCAELTTKLNDLENVRLMNAALSDHNGKLVLEAFDGRRVSLGGMSRIRQPDDAPSAAHVVPVQGVMLDEVIPQDRVVAAIQLDVEGHEENALRGSLETIKRNLPVLVVERMPTTDWFDLHLRPLGYQKTGTVHQNTVLRSI